MSIENLKTKCLAETLKHIKRVGFFINICVKELSERAQNHDNSKLEEPELTGFAINTERLSKVEYGSSEYKEMLQELKPTIEHHYANNRHHTEHWPNGINDMNLIDVLEMLCDWKAAGERNKNGNIKKSIEVNAEKYGINQQLKTILENTARDLFK
jgi:hypothetical protein